MSELVQAMKEMRDRRAPQLPDAVIEMAARDVGHDIESLGAFFRERGRSLSRDDLSLLYSMRLEATNAGADPGSATPAVEPPVNGSPTPRPHVVPETPPMPPSASTPHGHGRPEPSSSATSDAVELPDLEMFSGDCDVFDAKDSRLQVSLRGERLLARWPAADVPHGRSAVYLVCAAKSGIPSQPDNHLRLAATTDTHIELPATATYVAVFVYVVTNPAQVQFERCVRYAVGRVLREVEDLEVVAQVHGVLLQWRKPAGVERVRVMRSLPDEELPDVTDNSLLLTVLGDGFRDEDVVPGATYQYRVFTEAAGLGAASGLTESSSGLVRSVRVPATPEAVEEIEGSLLPRGDDPGVTLSWPAVKRGQVTIHEQAGIPDPNVPVGVVLTADQFDRWKTAVGQRVIEPAQLSDGRHTLKWIPLAHQLGRDDEPRRTYTAVTEFANQFVIGANKVITYIGAIGEAEVDERVDWQLLRATWPVGANFLGVWLVRPGEPASGEPVRKVTRDEFERFGGIAFVTLPFSGCDVVVQGATRYGGTWVTGESRRVTYHGRWVLRYELVSSGRLGFSRVLRVAVERPDWPDISLTLTSSPHGFPLTAQDPDLSVLHSGPHTAGSLPVGELITVSAEFKVRRQDVHTRLFVSAPGITPIVVDPMPETAAPPAPMQPVAMRCPRCLLGSDLSVQFFRCAGSCAAAPDQALTRLSGKEVIDHPVFAVVRQTEVIRNKTVTAAPVESAVCARCRVVSEIHVCPHCHTSLPPHWWAHEVLGLTVIGARQSGKTSYLRVLSRYLENSLLPSIQGQLHPVDAQSEEKLAAMRKGLEQGKLETSTLASTADDRILQPTVLDVAQGPNGQIRSLSVFDVAGEDMATADRVRPYGTAMAGADVLLLLIDPLQLDGVRAWLQGTIPLPDQHPVRAATVIQNAAAQIRRTRNIPSGPIPQRVAVAFSKFDGLQLAAEILDSKFAHLIGPGNALWRDPYPLRPDLYLEADGHRMHDEVRALLHRVGEGSLVAAVESSFMEVRYMAMSALGHAPKGLTVSEAGPSPHRVGDPLRWLMWSNGWA